ncbi:MAG: iron ABC transporter permease [Planctomycetota bacterium]
MSRNATPLPFRFPPYGLRFPESVLPCPWYLALPAALVGLGVLVPLAYLLTSAVSGDLNAIRDTLLRTRTLTTVLNTLGLALAVLAVTTVLALPAAWLTTRTDLPARRVFAALLVLPLAVPGYLLAFTLLSVGGDYGASARWLGVGVPRLSGFPGALVALSIYNFPYMLLTLRAGFRGVDPSLSDAARSLGRGPWSAFFTVVLPQLRPALLAGGLLVVLHVVGDFGVVSLMRFETFSFALYQSLAFEPGYAAWLALMMLGFSATFIGVELWLLRGKRFDKAGTGPGRGVIAVRLGRMKIPAVLALLLFLLIAVGVPVGTSVYWALQPKLDNVSRDLVEAATASVEVALPTALAATALALPLAFMSVRYPGKRSRSLERLAFAGYATPGLAFGLALVWGSLWVDRFLVEPGETFLYQSLTVMVYAYTLHFLAEAVGPVRASLVHAGRRLEEASRSLGRGRVRTFTSVTLPLIRPGLIAAAALVFLSAMKELPLAMLLRPYDFDTLAFSLWDLTNEALYAEAAPFALAILGVSLGFVAVLLLTEGSKN